MTPDKFISIIKEVVELSAKGGVIENLIEPPGRNPDLELIKDSEWYLSLNAEGKERIKSIVSDSVSEAIFGFLCILDGVRTISESGKVSSIELNYVEDGKKILLNDQAKEYLHDIYNSA